MCVERCVSVKIFTTIIQMQPSTQCAFWWYIKPDLVRPNGERKKIGEIFWKFENLKKSEKFENFGKMWKFDKNWVCSFLWLNERCIIF